MQAKTVPIQAKKVKILAKTVAIQDNTSPIQAKAVALKYPINLWSKNNCGFNFKRQLDFFP